MQLLSCLGYCVSSNSHTFFISKNGSKSQTFFDVVIRIKVPIIIKESGVQHIASIQLRVYIIIIHTHKSYKVSYIHLLSELRSAFFKLKLRVLII